MPAVQQTKRGIFHICIRTEQKIINYTTAAFWKIIVGTQAAVVAVYKLIIWIIPVRSSTNT